MKNLQLIETICFQTDLKNSAIKLQRIAKRDFAKLSEMTLSIASSFLCCAHAGLASCSIPGSLSSEKHIIKLNSFKHSNVDSLIVDEAFSS